MTDIASVFKNFNGKWSLEREMRSFEGELQGTAKGQAAFSFSNPAYTEYLFHEEGMAIYASDEHKEERPFYRDYLYRLNNDAIELYHASGPDQGKPYQTYFLNDEKSGLKPVATHECGLDNYEGFYALIDENNFILTTKIWGDGNKNSLIKTVFRRLPE